MDKIRIEAGFITHATVKWYGGRYASPYLWKANKSDSGYQESWSDPWMTNKEKAEQKSGLSIIQKENRGRKI